MPPMPPHCPILPRAPLAGVLACLFVLVGFFVGGEAWAASAREFKPFLQDESAVLRIEQRPRCALVFRKSRVMVGTALSLKRRRLGALYLLLKTDQDRKWVKLSQIEKWKVLPRSELMLSLIHSTILRDLQRIEGSDATVTFKTSEKRYAVSLSVEGFTRSVDGRTMVIHLVENPAKPNSSEKPAHHRVRLDQIIPASFAIARPAR